MKWFGIILLIIFLIIFFTSIKIKLEYKRSDQDDRLKIELSVWANLLKLRYEVPALKIKSILQGVGVQQKGGIGVSEPKKKGKFRVTREKVKKMFIRVYKMRKQIVDLNEIVKKVSKQVTCERFEWSTKVGVGDAAATGVATGGMWGIKTVAIGLIAKYMRLKTSPKLTVNPAFQGHNIDTELLCILRFRIGNIIIAGTRIVFKLRKGREGLWQNILFRA